MLKKIEMVSDFFIYPFFSQNALKANIQNATYAGLAMLYWDSGYMANVECRRLASVFPMTRIKLVVMMNN